MLVRRSVETDESTTIRLRRYSMPNTDWILQVFTDHWNDLMVNYNKMISTCIESVNFKI